MDARPIGCGQRMSAGVYCARLAGHAGPHASLAADAVLCALCDADISSLSNEARADHFTADWQRQSCERQATRSRLFQIYVAAVALAAAAALALALFGCYR